MKNAINAIPKLALVGLSLALFTTSCKKENICISPSISDEGIDLGKAGHLKRPLSDYLNSQGSSSIYVAPFPDFQGWNSSLSETTIHLGAVDFNGTTAAYLATHGGKFIPTKVTGKIDEVKQKDGRVKVTVSLHTTNALSFAVTYDPDSVEPFPYLNNPLDFGDRPGELLMDTTLTPSLGTADFSFSFYNAAFGDAIPDFLDLVNDRFDDIIDVNFHSMANGVFHASSGYAEGTKGKLKIDQKGLFKTGWHGAVADGFPVEKVRYIAN